MVDMTFNSEAVGILNDYRKKHECPNVQVDSSLAQSAQKWAEALAQHCTMRHSEERNYGETLAYKSAYEGPVLFTASEACHQWYEQMDIHDFDRDFAYETGYFTQMVWLDTTAVGFGRAVSEDGTMAYVVAHFLPKGNVRGEFKRNVPHTKLPDLRMSRPDSSGPTSGHVSMGDGSHSQPDLVETDKDRKAREKMEKKEQDRLKKEQKAREKKEAKDRGSRASRPVSMGDVSDGQNPPDESEKDRKAREKLEKKEQKDREKREAKEAKEREKAEKRKSKADGASVGAMSHESVGPSIEETKEQKKAREKAEKEIKKRELKERKDREKSILKEEKERKKQEAKERKEKAKSRA